MFPAKDRSAETGGFNDHFNAGYWMYRLFMKFWLLWILFFWTTVRASRGIYSMSVEAKRIRPQQMRNIIYNCFAFLNKYRTLSQGSSFNFCRNYCMRVDRHRSQSTLSRAWFIKTSHFSNLIAKWSAYKMRRLNQLNSTYLNKMRVQLNVRLILSEVRQLIQLNATFFMCRI